MRKLQLWSLFREITSSIDGWDEETFQKSKDEMTFVKFLPKSGDWHKEEKYVIKIKITKEELNEEEDCFRKSS